MLRAVVDTNVVFEGLTHLGPSAKVVDAWKEYIVDSLARVVTVPDQESQRAAFEEMLHRYSQKESEAALREILSLRR